MTRRIPLTAAFLAGWLAAAPSMDGKSKHPAAQKPAGVFRVHTRLIEVNVIARDKKGNPVSDLRREEFTVFDSGKEIPLRVFSVVTAGNEPANPPPAAPETYSNRFEKRSEPITSVTVILLDGLNTEFEDQAYARQQIVKFLGEIRREDRVALYTLGRSLNVVHDFTTDAGPLIAALNQLKGTSSPILATSEGRDAEQLMPPQQPISIPPALQGPGRTSLFDDMFIREQAFSTRQRVLYTLAAIEAIAGHVSRLPGRKNLIWVSGSFPIMFLPADEGIPSRIRAPNIQYLETYSDEIEHAARAVNDANLAIYPVDARGLMTIQEFQAGERMQIDPRRPTFSSMSRMQSTFATMNELASLTGGKASYNSNDITGAVRRAFDDARVTYTLGYYLPAEEVDDRFHEIKVKVSRPGLELRYRKGYFARPDKPPDNRDIQAALQAVATSPLEASVIGLEANANRNPQENAALQVRLRVDPKDVTFDENAGLHVATLEVVMAQFDAAGKQLNGTKDTVNLRLKPATYEKIEREGLSFEKVVTIDPQAEKLRVVVRDDTTGAVGSLTIPLAQKP